MDVNKKSNTIKDETELKDDTYRLANEQENIDLNDIQVK